MSDIDLEEVAAFLIDVAKQAGDVITAARPTTTAAGEKKNSVDLVTETDQYAIPTLTSTRTYMHFPDTRAPSSAEIGVVLRQHLETCLLWNREMLALRWLNLLACIMLLF